MSKRITAFSGTRYPLLKHDEFYIRTALFDEGLSEAIEGDEWHHGDGDGFDQFIDHLGREWGFNVIAHPADWHLYGKKAGPIRNRNMLTTSNAQTLYAFPSKGMLYERKRSKGTLDCIKAALEMDIDVHTLWLP